MSRAADYTSVPLYVSVGTEERSYPALQKFAAEINQSGGNATFFALVSCCLSLIRDNFIETQYTRLAGVEHIVNLS